MNLQKMIPPLIATLVCWLSIGLVVLVTSSGADIRDIVLGIGVFVTAIMWAGWASSFSSKGSTAAAEKAKHQPDPSVALLLELLSEDERRQVRERLLDRVQSDGETSSLAELLGDQTPRAQQDAS